MNKLINMWKKMKIQKQSEMQEEAEKIDKAKLNLNNSKEIISIN